jgi:CRISPR-associated protein Cas2
MVRMAAPARPTAFRAMWVLAMFDLPMVLPAQRRAYTRFRKDLLEDGFTMMQFSVYQRHCASSESAEVHIQRIGRKLPAEGEVRFLVITDRQFGNIRTFWGRKRQPKAESPAQMEFF